MLRILTIGFLGLLLAAGQASESTREISTEGLERILAARSATVLDTRPSREYAISHIPGAVNVAPKPGVPISMYVSDVTEIGRLVRGNKAAPLVSTATALTAAKANAWRPS
jgi:rhodanese-related sulfurtransferase